MIETIKGFFAASPGLVWSIVSVLLSMVVMAALWEKLKWWWLNTWMSFPFWGHIASLSKSITREESPDSPWFNWFKAETTLCQLYKPFASVQSEHDFNENSKYLSRAGDKGRTPMPIWIWILTALLVFVEALGFSYVLAGWTMPGASENLQQTGALGIAFLVSVILVAFTHWAGRELYVSSKIKHARREWVEDGRKQPLKTKVIDLDIPQSTDDGMPGYTQVGNRVGTHATYKISILTFIVVLLVAAGATYVRGQVLEKTLHDEVVGKSAQMDNVAPTNSDGLNMAVKEAGSSALPDADVAQNRAAKEKVVMDETNIDRHGGWGTFMVLAVIFVFLQILGIIFGYKWGFAGRESKDAFRANGNGRYLRYSDALQHFKEITNTAQANLEVLQKKIMERNADGGTTGMHARKSFREFLDIERREDSHYEKKQEEQNVQKAVLPTIDEAVLKLESLQDKDSKKGYIHSLPQPLQGNVLNAIKAAKEAEKANAARNDNAARAQLDAELDNLL